MNKSITKKQESGLANLAAIKEAQSLSGEGFQTSIPFIPIIRVNNKKEEQTALINGKEKKIKVLPDAGFNITRKNENTGEYTIDLFANEIEAVVLRVRHKIMEKYDRTNPKHKSFYSQEFDMIDPNIKVFDGETKKEIACGNYGELKEKFKTGENESGFPTKSFDLVMIMYIDIGGEVYRFERKVTKNDEWYNYRSKFARDDTFVGYKTKFILTKETNGEVEYWALKFEKGENVDLMKEIELQREINKYFFASQIARESKKELLPVIQLEEEAEEINPTAPDISDGATPPDTEVLPF